MGHVFGTDGLRPSPNRIQAILNMPVPQDKTGLQRFMGMANYLHKFIPNLASIDKPLRHFVSCWKSQWSGTGWKHSRKRTKSLSPVSPKAPVFK